MFSFIRSYAKYEFPCQGRDGQARGYYSLPARTIRGSPEKSPVSYVTYPLPQERGGPTNHCPLYRHWDASTAAFSEDPSKAYVAANNKQVPLGRGPTRHVRLLPAKVLSVTPPLVSS